MKCPVKRLTQTARLPSYGRQGDAGLDIYADENMTIAPRQKVLVSTGIAMQIPQHHVGLVWDRSGMAAKHGIHCLAGVVDETYRGEIKIVLINLSDTLYEIHQGDRIAQMLIQPVVRVAVEEADVLEESVRSEQGFGSSGR